MTSTNPTLAQPNTAQSASGAPYANATKGKSLGGPGGSAVAGGAHQHGNATDSHGTVNSIPPVIPLVGAPPIVSSGSMANGSNSDRHRQSSAVTISAQGTTGYLPNGSSGGPHPRPVISFGDMPANDCATLAQATPHSRLSTPMTDYKGQPRSPSPIPQPPALSGGRPTPQGHGNQMTFGNLGGSEAIDQSRPSPLPTGPASLAQSHLRRESSHSQHSDMSAGPRNYMAGSGRGRGYNQQYPQHQAHLRGSPAMQPRGLSSNIQPFIPQGARASPYSSNRSPAVPSAIMHPQPHLINGQPMPQHYGYPQHFNPQVNDPSFFNLPRESSVVSAAQEASNSSHHRCDSENFDRYLIALKNPAMYGVPGQELFPGYYGPPYMPPSMQFAAPSSPQFGNISHGPHPGYMTSAYQPAPTIDRSASQQSAEPRPSPARSQNPQTPSMPSSQPPPVVFSGPPSVSRPKSKALVIKAPDGAIVDISKIKTSQSTASTSASAPTPVSAPETPAAPAPTLIPAPAPAPVSITASVPAPAPAPASRSPPIVSSSVGVPSVSSQPKLVESAQPVKADSQNFMSSEETKRQFTEQFKRQLQEAGKKEEDDDDENQISESDDSPAIDKVADLTEESVAEEPKPCADVTTSSPTEVSVDEAERKRKEDEEMEAMIRELEEQERLEDEREREYQKKRGQEKKIQAQKEEAIRVQIQKVAASISDEELRRLQNEADALEAAKEKGPVDEEAVRLFASLKKSTLGSGPVEPEASAPLPETTESLSSDAPSGKFAPSRQKPSMLKLETGKAVEPAQPTAGMQSLKSARFLKLQTQDNIYPDGIRSPNPALSQGANSRGRQYNMEFLMQFQDVFKEQPSINWDKILRDTLGDPADSARTQPRSGSSAGVRQGSRNATNVMGSFHAGGRVLPPGSTSEQRFAASNSVTRMGNGFNAGPLGGFAQGRSGMGFSMVAPPLSRTGSTQSRGPQNLNSSRAGSARGSSRRDHKGNTAQDVQMAKTMPLTAGKDLKPLEVSRSGWKPISVGQAPNAAPVGHLTPEVVQRKVKSALNKMTPEKFSKISGDILQIAAQSKDESDGRTLRQIIQLTFEKACDEAHWASMYAKFCKHMMEAMSLDIKDENVKDKAGKPVLGGALFRKYLLNRCQEEFERGWEINLPMRQEGQTEEAAMLSEDYYVAAAAKRRGLGLIQFIGELYKLEMLTVRIMHECVVKLLNFNGLPEESTVESLVKLLRTIGATMVGFENGREMLKIYFARIDTIMKSPQLPSRMYYMLLDTVDLRKLGWASKDTDKGPKTIAEIHDDAARAAASAELERQKQARVGGRLGAGRGDSRSFSGNMAPPPDYSRNIGMDDLKKLARGSRSGQNSGPFGPSSMLSGSRSGSRRGLGPPRADDSGPSSRIGTPPVKDKEPIARGNVFSVLADDNGENDVTSPPSVSPVLSKSTPAINSEESKAS